MPFGITLSRHIIEEEHRHPSTTGEFSILLQQISFAGRVLAHEVGRAALGSNTGAAGIGPTGDPQQKLDVYADEIMREAFARSKLVAGIASEEMERAETLSIAPEAKYLLCLDPLDGSANADANAPLGTIFGIFRRPATGAPPTERDFLRPGREMVAAGYLLYGPSTMLVYTVGEGVHGFTLDRGGWRVHAEPPEPALSRAWHDLHRQHRSVRTVGRAGAEVHRPPQYPRSRHRPSLQAAVWRGPRRRRASLPHRGRRLHVSAHPDYPNGKLRLLYEAAPLALIAEQAGGAASTGRSRVLDLVPGSLHGTTPVVVGSAAEVSLYERMNG